MLQLNKNVTIASVTDGTSNTFYGGENAVALTQKYDSPAGASDWNWWTSGNNGDTLSTTMYPPNLFRKLNGKNITGIIGANVSIIYQGFQSLHPGGINMGFVDGSVHFIKDTVSVAPYNGQTGVPNNLVLDTNLVPMYTAVTGQPKGVWQSLSSVNGGEVLSADQY
jgi:prepilin-type processing-associated H-X9-DG protein